MLNSKVFSRASNKTSSTQNTIAIENCVVYMCDNYCSLPLPVPLKLTDSSNVRVTVVTVAYCCG